MRSSIISAMIGLSLLGAGCDLSQDYLEQGDALCVRSNRAISAIPAPSDLSEVGLFAGRLATETLNLAKKLEVADKPSGQAGIEVNKLIKDLTAGGQKSREVADAARREDLPATEKSVAETQALYKTLDSDARSVGYKECGKGGAKAVASLAKAAPGILRSAYIAKADARCAVANRGLQPVLDNPAKSYEELAKQLDIQVASDAKLIADLRALPAPSADKPALDEIFAGFDQIAAKNMELRDAAGARQQPRLTAALTELSQLLSAVVPKMDRFGFRDCGSAGTPR